jgi:hypothetical protein
MPHDMMTGTIGNIARLAQAAGELAKSADDAIWLTIAVASGLIACICLAVVALGLGSPKN